MGECGVACPKHEGRSHLALDIKLNNLINCLAQFWPGFCCPLAPYCVSIPSSQNGDVYSVPLNVGSMQFSLWFWKASQWRYSLESRGKLWTLEFKWHRDYNTMPTSEVRPNAFCIMLLAQDYERQRVQWGWFEWDDPHILRQFNTLFPVGDAIWEDLGGEALLEKNVSLGSRHWDFKNCTPFLNWSLCYLPAVWDAHSKEFLLPCFLVVMAIGLLSFLNHKPKVNPSFCKLPWS